MKKHLSFHTERYFKLDFNLMNAALLSALLFLPFLLFSQVNPTKPKTTKDHNKQVIGYITQWGPWKDIAGLIPKGSQNQLNVDYSQYTILNFSFFGVAVDGSIHSGDYRNPNIHQAGVDQAPSPLINTDIYSSWDLYLLHGELEVLHHIADGSNAYNLGYRNSNGGWTNINTNESGVFPLSIHKAGGKLGLIDLAHQQGVKVMASIGGWSMGKHFGDMAADATKRGRFINDCKRLIAMGFDGIDLDWEYPGQAGMNFTGQPRDYTNFVILVEQIRAAIGTSKLITSCFTAVPSKFAPFDWTRLSKSMDYYNFMTYDYNGGWSDKAGHNAPLYDYPNSEFANFSLDATTKGIKAAGIPLSKVNLGVAFYGRGVVTNGPAALNAPTVKKQETISPDGTVMTAADYANWPKDVWDGTPNYNAIVASTASWTEHWDDNAKVPYKTNGTYFLSYDNERSIGLKAQYIKDQQLAGVIVWTVPGDWFGLTTNTTTYGGKLVYSPNTKAPLINKVNEVFGSAIVTNPAPTVTISSPANNATFTSGSNVTITANATDVAPGTISKVEFFQGTTKLGEDLTSPYSFTWTAPINGTYNITAKATDNGGATATSAPVKITVGTVTNSAPSTSLTAPSNNATYTSPATVTLTATATDTDGTVAKVEFFNGTTKLGEDLTNPYSYTWSNVAAGTYNLTAKVTDNGGLTGTSAIVKITVNAPQGCTTPAWVSTTAYTTGAQVSKGGNKYEAKWWTQGNDPVTNSCAECVWKLIGPCGTAAINPTTSISSPANNATFSAPATISIAANAADADGTVAKVEFFNGSTKLGEDLTAPYTYSWTNVAAGTYTLTSKATDNTGATGTSAAVTVTVGTVSNPVPVATITSPANSASFNAPASIAMTATATDNGTVSKVEFFNGATKVGEDLTSPYSFTWANVAAGTYSLTVKATDNLGAVGTSAVVTVTVKAVTSGCTGKPQYVENGGYVAGSQVQNGGSLYQCKPYPYTSWCNGAAWAYAPGTGSYWADAWTLVSSCTAAARIGAGEEINSYPNPIIAGGILNLEFPTTESNVEVELSSVSDGKKYTYTYKNTGKVELTVPNLPKGIILIKVKTNDKVWSKKLLSK